jgi:hypothetical protein
MYNQSFQCTYLEKDSLELYQEELLKAFGCETVDELIPAMDALHETIKTEELTQLLQKITQLTGVNEELGFYILFSFDYFSFMHDYLIDSSTYTLLYDKIKV